MIPVRRPFWVLACVTIHTLLPAASTAASLQQDSDWTQRVEEVSRERERRTEMLLDLPCTELSRSMHDHLSHLLSLNSPDALENVVLHKCSSNIELVTTALSMSVQSKRHCSLFKKALRSGNEVIQSALVHLAKTVKDLSEFSSLLAALSYSWEDTSIFNKGILHWIAIHDNVELMSQIVAKINPESASAQRAVCSTAFIVKNSFFIADDRGFSTFYYAQSVEMARLFDQLCVGWYIFVNKDGVSPFMEFLRSGKIELAESVALLPFRYQLWRGKYGPSLTRYRQQSIKVRRNNILRQFFRCKVNFHEAIPLFNVKFKGEYALDYGGPSLEFFSLGLQEIFLGTQHSMPYFEVVDEESGLYAPSKLYRPSKFEPIGKFIALAFLQQQIPVGAEFIPMIYHALLGFNSISEEMLKRQHPSIYRHLKFVQNNPDDIESFGIYFEDGDSVVVTSSNVNEFVHKQMEKKLIGEHKERIDAFVRGLRSLMPESLGKFISPRELALLMKGETCTTATEFLANVRYIFLRSDSGPVATFFPEAVSEFTNEQIMKLITFVTGRAVLPFGGIAALPTRIVIDCTDSDYASFPRASTCSSKLYIGTYDSPEQLKDMLLYVLNEDLVFGEA